MVRFCGCGAKVDHVDLFVPNLVRIAQISGKPNVVRLNESDLYSGEVACQECAQFLIMMGRKFMPFNIAKQQLRGVQWYHRKKKREEFFGIRQMDQEVEKISA